MMLTRFILDFKLQKYASHQYHILQRVLMKLITHAFAWNLLILSQIILVTTFCDEKVLTFQ